MKAPRSSYRWLWAALFVLLLVGAGVYRIYLHQRQVSVESIEDVQERQGIPVDVCQPRRTSLELWKTVVGTLEGEEQADVASQVSSHVERVACQEGDEVQAGDVLIYLYKNDPSLVVHHYEQAKAAYDRAEKNLKRSKRLYEERVIADRMLDEAVAGYEVAKANLSSARAGVVVTSPIAGTVLRIYVTKGDPVNARMSLVRVGRIDRIKAVVNLGAEDAGHISQNNRARLFFKGRGSGILEGKVVRKTLSADPVSRLFRIEALFPNPGGAVPTGVLVEVGLLLAASDNALILPRDAFLDLNKETPYIWTFDGDRAQRQEVSIGLITEEAVEVVAGVKEQEVVVVRGQNLLRGGEKVFIHDRLGSP